MEQIRLNFFLTEIKKKHNKGCASILETPQEEFTDQEPKIFYELVTNTRKSYTSTLRRKTVYTSQKIVSFVYF